MGPALTLGLVLLPTLILPACGDGETEAHEALPETARAPRDPRLVQAQEAFERGEPDVARTLLAQLVDVDPVDRAILEARLALAEGKPVDALRALGQAKERWPEDGRVYATEAELFAVLGRMGGAEDSLLEGLGKAGPCAELSRAKAVLALSIPGGAELGWQHLQEAYELDPNVPYAGHAAAQAHLLVGRMDLTRDAPGSALEHARAALAWDALDGDYRELEAEALAGLLRYDEALERFAELEEEGRPLRQRRALLHQQAATARVLLKDREGAREHYLAARALGLEGEELGFGVDLLREEAQVAVERGLEHYAAGRLGEALAAFERGLELDPDDLMARNHSGVLHFRLADHERAARAWRIVVDTAAAEGLELPEPVHLNLARALLLSGDADGALAACDRYLTVSPEGRFVDETRALRAELAAGG